MAEILQQTHLSDGWDVACVLSGRHTTIHFAQLPDDPQAAMDEMEAAEQVIAAEARVAQEIADCVAHVRVGGHPLDFVWQYSAQEVGLKIVFRALLALDLSELTPMAPMIAAFTTEIFGPLAGITAEQAAAIISWAQGVVAVEQLRQEIVESL